MVSGRTQDGDQVTIRRLPAIKSQSSISIPTAYHYYYQQQGQGQSGGQGQGQGGVGEQSQGQSQGQGSGFYPQTNSTTSSGFREQQGQGQGQGQSQGQSQPLGRGGGGGGRPLGPGHYHRTLSSSSLLSNKGSAVSKSRSDYCAVGVGSRSGGGLPSPQNFKDRTIVASGSSSNIVYIDHHSSNGPDFGGFTSNLGGGGGGPSSSGPSGNNGREFRERRLIRESSQPIIIHVPITAPKATATSLSRATSPPPPHYLSSLAAASSSPKKTKGRCSNKPGGGGGSGSGSKARAQIYKKPVRKLGEDEDDQDEEDAEREDDANSDEMEHKHELRLGGGGGSRGCGAGRGVKTKVKVKVKKGHQGEQTSLHFDETVLPTTTPTTIPSHLTKYFRNAPLSKVRHPLEENIFTSLLITLIAVGLALLIGIPVLFFTGGCLLLALSTRYSIFLLYGIYSYLCFICSNRGHLSSSSSGPTPHPPTILPRDRLAFANDVRWLGGGGGGGGGGGRKAQSILQTLLFFDGALDLGSLRHLILTRVIHAETHEGELAYPRLMQRVTPFPAGYRWEVDLTFDIVNHVLPGPSYVRNEREIQEYLGLLLTERLPLRKPLWEIRVITGYGVQRDTLAILRVHQCLADGMSLVRILSHSLADQAQMHIPQRPHFAGLSFGFNVIRSMIVGPLTFGMWMLTTFRDKNLFSVPLNRGRRSWMVVGWADWRGRWRNWRSGGGGGSGCDLESGSAQPNETDGNRINGDDVDVDADVNLKMGSTSSKGTGPRKNKKVPKKGMVVAKKSGTGKTVKKSGGVRKGPGSHWNVVWSAPLSIPKVARVKQIMRSSLNDVLLAAAAGSVRKYLQKQGIPCPDDVKVVIPIDLRNDLTSPKSSTKLGCKVASVLATIPSGMEGAIPRLWATRHRLDELKASADPVVAYGATTVLMNILPHPVGVAMLDNITNKASLQFSNLPGPTHTLIVGGYPLKGIYPIYPPSGKIRVGISAFSYADQVHLTVVAHRSLANAGPSLLQGITAQVDQLSKQLSARRVPGESRRSGRNASLNNPEITKPPTRQIHMQLQVVQEELQELSHRLDSPPTKVGVSIGVGSDNGPDEDLSSEEESLGGGVGMPGLSPGGQAQLRTRLKTLKTEFSELIGELRRRSSIVEGVAMSFEDEESEDDYRKPRKRALSVVSMSMSGRRNSLFSSSGRSNATPESSGCYSSDEDESPSHDVRMYNPNPGSSNIRISSSPIRTTAV